jgi:hypothetical protein
MVRGLPFSGPRRIPWSRWPGPVFHASAEFRAPLRFVFDWCTDYTPEDGPIGREPYLRKVIHRGPRLVILEDLEETERGWDWARLWVKLQPPRRWRCETIGSYHDFTINYELSPLPNGRTRLDLSWKLRSTRLEKNRPERHSMERSANRAWRYRRLALERDYRASRSRSGGGPHRRGRG